MSERIRSNWDNHADASVIVGLHFVIERDGRLTQVAIERSSLRVNVGDDWRTRWKWR